MPLILLAVSVNPSLSISMDVLKKAQRERERQQIQNSQISGRIIRKWKSLKALVLNLPNVVTL